MIYTDRWAFCHIPKTSGSNFKKSSWDKCMPSRLQIEHIKYPDTYYLYEHQPISYWVKSGIIPEEYQWITIVRNPYSWLVSWYYSLSQTTIDSGTGKPLVNEDPQSAVYHAKHHTFSEFINKDILGAFGGRIRWAKFKEEGGLWKPGWTQSKFLEGDHNIKIFHIEDLSELEDFAGFKFAHIRHNESFHDPWEEQYTKETRDIVYERYREDFENFGYDR